MARTTYAARIQNLTSAIEEAGTDGAHLAAAVGISKQFMSLLLRGHRRCNPTIAEAIARELRLPLSSLFTTGEVSEDSHNTEDRRMDTLQHDDDPILLFEEVAELCKIKPKTLRHYRAIGEGPPFSRYGRRGRLRIRKSQALEWYRETFENATE
ncbi:helix-turn-helix domain-containing protein [Nonomuraea aridisoli]|uniref:HTH cro/C1-type domain-containing protein n=1 Tax=Nonomuraea aridisoli TaxID=2070368 RepID=A0A2W2EWC6_9ACTN|nr:helix-turn-helix domain-containing protein [Nonomuraea aridisoli]PZG20575.1 hypothetical protein C1J01_08715 [Nonomuraea aridisoli]